MPANKGSLKYPLEQVFQVWNDHKERIVSSSYGGQSREMYKLSNPKPIYHVELGEAGRIYSNKASEHPGESAASWSNGVHDNVDLVTEKMAQLHTGQTGLEGKKVSQQDAKGEQSGVFHNEMNGSQNGHFGLVHIGLVDGAGYGSTLPDLRSNLGQSAHLEQHSQPQARGGSYPPSRFVSGSSQPELLPPLKIEWYYLDAAGHEQGPFNGEMMQDWLSEGYLNPDLRIRRPHQQQYITLKELCDRLENFVLPFAVPQPAHVPEPVPELQSLPFLNNLNPQLSQPLSHQLSQLMIGDFLPHDPFSANFGTNFVDNSSYINQLLMPSLLLQPLRQQPLHQNLQQPIQQNLQQILQPLQLHQLLHPAQQQLPISRGGTWGLGSSQSSMGPSLSGLGLQPPISPWAAGLSSRVSLPFVASSLELEEREKERKETSEKTEKSARSAAEPLMVQPGHLDSKSSLVVEPSSTPRPDLPLKVEAPAQKLESNQARIAERTDISEPKTNVPDVQQSQKKKIHQVTVSVPIETAQPVEQPVPASPGHKVTVPVQPAVQKVVKTTETKKPAASLLPVVPPWAAKEPAVAKPLLTMKEIQALEAEKLEKQRLVEAEAKSAENARAWAAAALEEKVQERPALPSTASWGVSATVAPVKTLAEIQKEEAEAARTKQAKPVGPSSSFASTLANSVPKDDGFWTTVATKKAPAKKAALQTISTTSTSASAATPQVLRTVSAARAPVSSSTVPAQEDFVVWARSAMTNLYPTVSKDDLLDVFLALPANGDSSLLIGETIYSSSATMDGRRFAEEFLKRRKKLELQIGSVSAPEWTAAIASSATKSQTVDEDGWSTSLKGKKKKRV